ncbi:bifunctional NUDIX hydrolase/phosphatase PAP2 family protein [Vibrio algicola]|nr:bifunctional NUDIX hydrolase/phosphatase PAP2 family protein [Vibrio algicola]
MSFTWKRKLNQAIIAMLAMFTLIFSIQSSAQTVNPNTPQLKGALCFIKADEQVVFVQEMLTNRYSLPGGTIEAGETPAAAAERETWEESGLVVHVKKLLTQTDTAYIFECSADSAIVAFRFQNKEGFHSLPAWFAPSFGSESRRVYLASPNYMSANQYRFPAQWKQQVSGHDVDNQPVQYINDAITAAPALHQIELPFIQMVQSSVRDLDNPFSQAFSWVMTMLDTMSGFFFILFMLPLFNYLFGSKFTTHLCLIVVIAAVLVFFTQIGLKLPRPDAYLPDLQMSEKAGFGTPSLSATLSVVWLSYIFNGLVEQYEEFEYHKNLPLLVLLILAQGFASVWLGTHFWSDVFFGYALGLLIAWHYLRIEQQKNLHALNTMASPALWWILTILLNGFAFYSHSLLIGELAAMTLAFAVILTIKPRRWHLGKVGTIKRQLLLTWIVAILVMFGYHKLADIFSYSGVLTYLIHYLMVLILTLNAMTLGRVQAHQNAYRY